MSLSPSSLRVGLARTIEALGELDTHPEDEAIVWSIRTRLDGPADHALEELDALISREQARGIEAQAAVDAAEREEQASEDRDAGPIALSA